MTKRKSSRNRLTLSTYFVELNDWISQAEAARIRGVSRQAIARLVAKKRFATLQLGGRLLLKRSDVEVYTPAEPGRPSNEHKNRKRQESH